MTIIKETEYETTIANLEYISNNLCEYDFTANQYQITITNSYGRVILVINNQSFSSTETVNIIEVANLLQEHNNSELYKKYCQDCKDNGIRPDPPHWWSGGNDWLSSGTDSGMLTYRWYYDEALCFQQMTLRDNVLPYDATWFINKIKNEVADIVSFNCGGFKDREEYENNYQY